MTTPKDEEVTAEAIKTGSELISDKALESLDGLIAKITTAADTVTQKLVEVTPEVAEAMLNLVQFRGGFDILTSLLATSLLAAPLIYGTLWFCRNFDDIAHESQCGLFCMIIVSYVAFIVFLFTGSDLLSFESWLALVYPEGYLGLKALEAVGINI